MADVVPAEKFDLTAPEIVDETRNERDLRLWLEENFTRAQKNTENHTLITPPAYEEDPHPQYFHLINDTAWAGIHLSTDQLLLPGDVVNPFDNVLFPDWKLVTNLVDGTITLPVGKSGGYQFNLYWTFQAVSNGGTFVFEIFVDGVASGVASVANLSNQSDIGTGVITAFFPIDMPTAPKVLDFRFDSLSSKNITMLDVVWTLYRVFPSEGSLD